MRKLVLAILGATLFALAVVAVCWALDSRDSGPVSLDEDQALLPAVLQGMDNAVSSVRSGRGAISVRFTLNDEDGVAKLETNDTYSVVFSRDSFKIIVATEYLRNDFPNGEGGRVRPIPAGEVIRREVSCDGQNMTVYRADDKSAVVTDRSHKTGGWEFSEWRVSGRIPGVGVLDPDALGSQLPGYTPKPLRLVGHQVLDGGECKVLELTEQPSKAEAVSYIWWFWVDVDRGYTVPLTRCWAQGGMFKQKTLVSQVESEIGTYNGTWGPRRTTITEFRLKPSSDQTYVQTQQVITYEADFALNVPVSDSELRLTLPTGTTVTDEALDAEYVVP